MIVARDAAAARRAAADLRRPVAFVPTMGALHAGHLRLVDAARARAAATIVSLFVNPLQFAPDEDFARYPRAFDADVGALAAAGVDLVYAPEAADVYPPGFASAVVVAGPAHGFEGARRPDHFSGVATVVLKFLHLLAPDVLVLGRKDAQQVAVLRAMLRDLDLPVEILAVPTDREPDGLARSSRNVYLAAPERAAAPSLRRGLGLAAERFAAGAGVAAALAAAEAAILPPLSVEYLAIVDEAAFAPVEDPAAGALVVGAVRAGATRLLDNVAVPRA